MSEETFSEVLVHAERILIPLGVWPSVWNSWITLLNIFVLFVYSILVLIKNLLNPEGESVENAFTLANGGLITVVYFVTMYLKKQKCLALYEFIKNDCKLAVTNEEIQIEKNFGKEFMKISSAFLKFFSVAVLIRFLLPTVEYAYFKLKNTNQTFELPPAMGLPVELFGEIPTYIVESFVRALMLSTLMGVCSAFIITTLTICSQCNILSLRLKNMKTDNVETLTQLIQLHEKLLSLTKLLNEIFSPYFFADCIFSFINLSIMMFSLIAHNAHVQNFLSEAPLVLCGMSQLFFVLYFGDRLISETGAISTAAYTSEWYGKSIKHQKNIQFIIMRAQKPQMLTIGNGFMVASMLLFSQICQRAWGAFNILRTTVQR